MKTFQQIGTDIGSLVEQKNAAYGSSFAKAGDFLKLLYPNGLAPEQYADALLLVRIFDKQVRIATDRDALGESPYSDITGYGILGTHLHQSPTNESTTCPANANGAAKTSRNDPPASAANNAKSTTAPSTSAKAGPAHSPQPDGCSSPLGSAPAPTATANANASAADPPDLSRAILERLDLMWPEHVPFHHLPHAATDPGAVNRMLDHLFKERLVQGQGHFIAITELGHAAVYGSRLMDRYAECGAILGFPGRTRTCVCTLARGHEGRHHATNGTSWRNLK